MILIEQRIVRDAQEGKTMTYVFGWVPVGGKFQFEGDDRTWCVDEDGSAITEGGVRLSNVHSCTPVVLVESV